MSGWHWGYGLWIKIVLDVHPRMRRLTKNRYTIGSLISNDSKLNDNSVQMFSFVQEVNSALHVFFSLFVMMMCVSCRLISWFSFHFIDLLTCKRQSWHYFKIPLWWWWWWLEAWLRGWWWLNPLAPPFGVGDVLAAEGINLIVRSVKGSNSFEGTRLNSVTKK